MMRSATSAQEANRSKYVVSAGFVAVLALLASIIVTSLSEMRAIKDKMDAIANVHEVKKEILASMREIVVSRSMTMYAIYLMKDPLQREEEYSHFNELATQFMLLRERLATIGLNAREAEALERALRLIRYTAPLQEGIIDKIRDGAISDVDLLMVSQDLPLEKRIIAHFDTLISLERAASREALEQAEQAYDRTYVITLSLGLLTLLLGLAIAWLVVRRTGRIENLLFEGKEQAEVTLHAIGDGVITMDSAGLITYLNPVAERLTGWCAREAVGQSADKIYRIIYSRTSAQPPLLGRLASASGGGDDHYVLISKDGREFAVEDSVSPIRNRAGNCIGTVLVFRDVSEARNLQRQLSWQASHDSLTGLCNRRRFEESLQEALTESRAEGTAHAVLYLDLDQFKAVNDTCGHQGGDELLRQLALRLHSKVRSGDTIARLGGDEFGILLRGCDAERAVSLANQLLELVQEFRFVWNEKTFRIGASIGVAPIHRGSGDVVAVLGAADTACYVAKEHGRNRIWLLDAEDHELVQRRSELELISEMAAAFEAERFLLYKQQIVPLKPTPADKAQPPAHFELLIRMRDERATLITPMAFIPAAERHGLMPTIDRWVIRTAFRHLSRHAGARETFSINISAQSLSDDLFLDFVMEQFRRTNVRPQDLCFEITETSAIANWVRAHRFVTALKERGCRFALDDFGSGMSSFSYLKNLPVDFIKIDGVFVKDMIADETDFVMVQSIHRIGHVMGIKTIAEFVENEAIAARLRDIGVDYAQGYGLHIPEPL